MRYHFFARINEPTAFELAPTLEDVFHEPERYRKYFKPFLRLDPTDIVMGFQGPFYFLYTTFVRNGELLTFRRREGKYELVQYDGGTGYVPVSDLGAYFEQLGQHFEHEEEGDLAEISMQYDNANAYTGRWLKLHTMDTDAEVGSDTWREALATLKSNMGKDRFDFRSDDGHFGGAPRWLQGYWEQGDFKGTFMGQVSAYNLGDFPSWNIAYMFIRRAGDEEILECVWETT